MEAKTLQYYASHYLLPSQRQVFLQYAKELPLGHSSVASHALEVMMDGYKDYLCDNVVPKLVLYSTPGFVADADCLNWVKQNVLNVTVTNIGMGYHYAPETNPTAFIEGLQTWLIGQKLVAHLTDEL